MPPTPKKRPDQPQYSLWTAPLVKARQARFQKTIDPSIFKEAMDLDDYWKKLEDDEQVKPFRAPVTPNVLNKPA